MARAFIKNPKLFIFDEATSALDKNNERIVQEAINRIKGVTVITIAHRLSTVRDADKIIVMGKGVQKEEGSHDELLKKYPDGLYAKLVANEQRLESKTDKSQLVAEKAVADEDLVATADSISDQKMNEANKLLEEK